MVNQTVTVSLHGLLGALSYPVKKRYISYTLYLDSFTAWLQSPCTILYLLYVFSSIEQNIQQYIICDREIKKGSVEKGRSAI